MTDAELVDLAGEDGLDALRAIANARQAWSRWDDIAKERSGVLERLEADGLVLVEHWRRTDYLGVTLTPYAAEVMGLTLIEYSTPSETPYWIATCVAEHMQGPILLQPVYLMTRLLFPELLADHRQPEPLIDDATQEQMVLFTGPEGKEPGVPVFKEKAKPGRGKKRRSVPYDKQQPKKRKAK